MAVSCGTMRPISSEEMLISSLGSASSPSRRSRHTDACRAQHGPRRAPLRAKRAAGGDKSAAVALPSPLPRRISISQSQHRIWRALLAPRTDNGDKLRMCFRGNTYTMNFFVGATAPTDGQVFAAAGGRIAEDTEIEIKAAVVDRLVAEACYSLRGIAFLYPVNSSGCDGKSAAVHAVGCFNDVDEVRGHIGSTGPGGRGIPIIKQL